jgi:hypothetical protein
MKPFVYSLALFSILASASLALADEPVIGEPDISASRDITLQQAPWTYTPADGDVPLTHEPLKLPTEKVGDRPGWGGQDFVVPAGPARFAYQANGGSEIIDGRKTNWWALYIVDLQKGTTHGPIHLPNGLTARAISADGKRVALSSAARFDPNPSVFSVGEIDQNSVTLKVTFIPYEGEPKGNRRVQWARFLDADHVLTINEGRGESESLMLWDLGQAGSIKRLWSWKMGRRLGGPPVQMADGKHLIVNDTTGTYILDGMTAKVVGSMCDAASGSWFINADLKLVPRLDGLMLARATQHRLTILSLAGEPRTVADISMPPNTRLSDAAWVGNDYVLINQTYLVDIPKQMIVWKYTGLGGEGRNQAILFPGDGRLWRVSVGDDGLVDIDGLTLPEKRVTQTIASLDMSKVMAVTPGQKVTLDVQIPDAVLANSVRRHFEAELKKNNMILAADQPLKLRVKMGEFDTEKVEYRDVGQHLGPGQQLDVSTKEMSVCYELNGQQLWGTVLYAGAPLLVSIKSGQTLQGAIAQDQAGIWRQIDFQELPKMVPAYREDPGFGASALDEPMTDPARAAKEITPAIQAPPPPGVPKPVATSEPSLIPTTSPQPSSVTPPPPASTRNRSGSMGIPVDRLKTTGERSILGDIQSVTDAQKLLAGSDADAQHAAAYWLATSVVDDAQRNLVLAALKPFLNEPDGHRRLLFVQAYEHWVDTAHAADLAAILDYPAKTQGLSYHENCWAVAVTGLVRVAPTMAQDAVQKRIEFFFFRTDTARALAPIAESDGPNHELASHLIDEVKNYHR